MEEWFVRKGFFFFSKHFGLFHLAGSETFSAKKIHLNLSSFSLSFSLSSSLLFSCFFSILVFYLLLSCLSSSLFVLNRPLLSCLSFSVSLSLSLSVSVCFCLSLFLSLSPRVVLCVMVLCGVCRCGRGVVVGRGVCLCVFVCCAAR